VKPKKHYMSRNTGLRGELPVKLALAVILVIGGIAAAAYSWLIPTFSSTFPFSCNLSPTALDTIGDNSSVSSDDAATEKFVGIANGCQEIEEVTSPGDTLFSILNDNVADEQVA